MRVLVCGWREYADKAKVWRTLDRICDINDATWIAPHVTIIHGGANGADSLADAWAVSSYARVRQFKADWKAHGKAAGPTRNQQMIDEGKPDLVIAFPGGRGTADMVGRARKAGIEVLEVEA